MAKQGRSQGGKFAPKSNEFRLVRSMRLTDTAWVRLGEIADSRGITRADLIEEWAKYPPTPGTDQLELFDVQAPTLIACPKCGSDQLGKDGFLRRMNKNGSRVNEQRYVCRSCHHKFAEHRAIKRG